MKVTKIRFEKQGSWYNIVSTDAYTAMGFNLKIKNPKKKVVLGLILNYFNVAYIRDPHCTSTKKLCLEFDKL